MTREEWNKAVRAQKILRGETTSEIAHAINYSASHVEKVISGGCRSVRVEAALSEYLGIDPPSDYLERREK